MGEVFLVFLGLSRKKTFDFAQSLFNQHVLLKKQAISRIL